MKNQAHLLLETHLAELGIGYAIEYPFALKIGRKWRFDFMLAEWNAAIEIEGAIYSRGRHTRGKGYQGDLDKYNHATAMGYRVFRFSTQDVLRGRARAFLKHYFGASGEL